MKTGQRKYTKDEIATMGDNAVEMYVNKNFSIRQIASAVGCSYGMVRQLLLNRDVMIRQWGGSRSSAKSSRAVPNTTNTDARGSA